MDLHYLGGDRLEYHAVLCSASKCIRVALKTIATIKRLVVPCRIGDVNTYLEKADVQTFVKTFCDDCVATDKAVEQPAPTPGRGKRAAAAAAAASLSKIAAGDLLVDGTPTGDEKAPETIPKKKFDKIFEKLKTEKAKSRASEKEVSSLRTEVEELKVTLEGLRGFALLMLLSWF